MVATGGGTGKGIRLTKSLFLVCIYGSNVVGARLLGVSLMGVGTLLRLERDTWSRWSND